MSSVAALLAAITADPDRSPAAILDAARASASRLDGDATPLELDRAPGERVHVTQDGDTLDSIAHRHYGTVAAVRDLLSANPALAGSAARLPGGARVLLPDIGAAPANETAPVQLWD